MNYRTNLTYTYNKSTTPGGINIKIFLVEPIIPDKKKRSMNITQVNHLIGTLNTILIQMSLRAYHMSTLMGLRLRSLTWLKTNLTKLKSLTLLKTNLTEHNSLTWLKTNLTKLKSLTWLKTNLTDLKFLTWSSPSCMSSQSLPGVATSSCGRVRIMTRFCLRASRPPTTTPHVTLQCWHSTDKCWKI